MPAEREDLLGATEADLAPVAAPGRRRADEGPGQDRRRRREDHEQAQGSQALHPRRRHQGSWPGSATSPPSTPRGPPTGFTSSAPPSADTLGAPGAVAAYKDLANLERDFRHIKADDLDLRPIWHRLEERVRAHVLICMLACYLVWHLRQAWAPLTFTDEYPPGRASPVTPARRSPSADAKAARKAGPGNQPIRSFRDIIDHLATLTRNDRAIDGQANIPALAEPTPNQRRAFDLIGASIPLTLNIT